MRMGMDARRTLRRPPARPRPSYLDGASVRERAPKASLAASLRAEPPLLHADGECWGLAWPALAWLEETLQPGMSTLETGAGLSTIVFAARGTDHEVVTPSAPEIERIRGECERRGISTDRLRFHVGSSHEVLPQREPHALDLALIDGAHGFPYPILDWWHIAPSLRVGGLVLLDDAYMPPVGVLVDALRGQPGWRFERTIGYRTVLLRKVAETLPAFDWAGEPIGTARSFRYLRPAPRAVAAVRDRAFTTRAGLHAVRLVRRRAGFLFSAAR